MVIMKSNQSVTYIAVVFPEDPSEKDPALEGDYIRCPEKTQSPVTAKAQDL